MKYTLNNKEIDINRFRGVNGGYYSTCFVNSKFLFQVNGKTQEECIGKEMMKLGEYNL